MARPVGVLEERGMQSVSQYERQRIEKLLTKVRDETAREALGVMARHPDGLVVGAAEEIAKEFARLYRVEDTVGVVLVACEELRGLRRR